MSRSYGSNAQALAAFEAEYGLAPASDFKKIPFYSTNLGSVQNLIEDELLGNGREPQAPDRDVIDDDGDLVVPVDLRNMGLWLKALLGNPDTTDNYAEGYIKFKTNPANNSTIALNGVHFTFVSVAPTGAEIQIGGTLDATLDNAVAVLNEYVDEDVDDAVYSHASGSKILDVVHKTVGAAGNDFTLAASEATVSGATLTGGDAKLHVFASGADDLPSMAIEIGHTKVPAYFMNLGLTLNEMTYNFVRSGTARATLKFIGQNEIKNAATQGGTPSTLALKKFNQFQGFVKRGGMRLGNITNAQFTYSNNIEKIDNIREDGLIDGLDPAAATLKGQIVSRFATTDLFDLASNYTPVDLDLGYRISASQRLSWDVHEVYLPKPKIPIDGPGGVQATFDWQAAFNQSAGRMATIKLVNDVESY